MAETVTPTRIRRGCIAPAALLLALCASLAGPAAAATHYPPGASCYDCHAISESKMVVGTKLIKKSQKTVDLGITSSLTPIPCLFCHERNAVSATNRTEMKGVWEHFNASSMSKHLVKDAAGTEGNYSTFTADNSSFDCLDCHTGITNGVVGDNAGNARVHGIDASASNSILYPSLIGAPANAAQVASNTCQNAACHSATGTTQGGYTAPARHAFGKTTLNGGAAPADCLSCHGKHNSYQNASLVTLRTDGTTSNNPTDPLATVVAPDKCGQCHNQDDDRDPGTAGVQDDWSLRGHGMPTSYGGDRVALNCLSCHDSSKPHVWDGSDKRFSLPPVPGLSGMGTGKSKLSVCTTCHPGFTEHKGTAGCLDCHDPHGQDLGTSGDYNIMMVRRQVPVATPLDSIIFKVSGIHGTPATFDYWRSGDTGGYLGSSRGACDNYDCHALPRGTPPLPVQNPNGHNVWTLSSYFGTYGTEHGLGQAGVPPIGGNCQGCHRHSMIKPQFGFGAGDVCGSCHGFPPNSTDSLVDNSDAVGVHDTHIAIYGNSSCGLCHYNNTHNEANWSANTGKPIPAGTVNVAFDPTMNPTVGGNVPTYNPATNTCSNLRCHNPDSGPVGTGVGITGKSNTPTANAPQWLGAESDSTTPHPAITACTDCHAVSPVSNPDLGSHYKHDNPAARGYSCQVCHAGENAAANRFSGEHANGSLDTGSALVSLDLTLAGVPAGGSYTDGSSGLTGGTCQNLYCHGASLTNGGGSHISAPNWPTWGTAATGACGTCHDGDGRLAPAGDGSLISSGNHTDHLTATYGPQFGAAGCGSCHSAYGPSTASHVNGTEDFTNVNTSVATISVLGATAPAGAPDATSTDRCSNCHSTATVNGTVGTVVAKAGWSNPVTQLACVTCHNGIDPATDNAAGTIDATHPTAPDVLGDDVNYGAEVLGHNRTTGSYPVSGNGAANRTCAACHDVTAAHFDAANGTNFATQRLLTTINTVATGSTVTGACNACHATAAGAPALSQVSTHGNTNPAFQATNTHDPNAEDFVYNCAACHEVHGMTKNGRTATSANVYMVRSAVEVKNYTSPATGADRATTVSVVFEARTGAESFDDGATPANNVCVACHTNAGRPGSISSLTNAAGDGTHAGLDVFGSNVQGGDCSLCHTHNYDTNALGTADGLMPARCDGCHGYPPATNAHAAHVTTAQMDCARCHQNSGHHNDLGIADAVTYAATPIATIRQNVDVAFDAFNPNGTYSQAKGSRSGLANGTCSVLYCHGADSPFPVNTRGTDTTPEWNVPATGACGTCHLDTNATWNGTGGSGWHQKHVGTAVAGGYDMGCDLCHYSVTTNGTTLTNRTNHVNRQANVAFSAVDSRLNTTLPPVSTYTGDTVVGSGFGTCDNTFCHSQANDLVPPFQQPPNSATMTWDSVSTSCSNCHASAIGGGPGYADGTLIDGVPKANKHPKHNLNGTGCASCHGWFSTAAFTTYHANGQYDPTGGGNNTLDDFTFTRGVTAGGINGTCSATVCHGGNTVAWAENMTAAPWNANGNHFTCDICHGEVGGAATATDVNDFSINPQAAGAVMSKVSATEYTGAGHGKPGPNRACAACHTSAVNHDSNADLSGANPYRLIDQDGGTAGVQFSCSYNAASCHPAGTNTPANGIDYQAIVSHTSAAMTSTGYAPRYAWSFAPDCVNCHDPHGDGGNLSMVQRELYDKAAFPLPVGAPPAAPTEQTNLLFTDNLTGQSTAGTSYADSDTPFSSICQECHEGTAGTTTTKGFVDNTSANYNGHPGWLTQTADNPSDCSACHKHDGGFQPSGCDSCHGNTVTQQWWPDGAAYPDRAGDHQQHIDAIAARMSWTTVSQKNGSCNWCHPNPGGPRPGTAETTHADYVAPADVHNDSRAGATASHFKTILGASNGILTDAYDSTAQVCSNVDCHNRMPTPSTTSVPAARAGNWSSPPNMDATFTFSDVAIGLVPASFNRTYRVGCFVCHGYYGPPRTSADAAVYADYRDNTHKAHAGRTLQTSDTGMAYECYQCHGITTDSGAHNATLYSVAYESRPYALGTNDAHQNGVVEINFTNANAIETTAGGANGYYTRGGNTNPVATFAYGQDPGTAACNAVYCHGETLASKPDATRINPGYKDYLTGGCGACHDADYREDTTADDYGGVTAVGKIKSRGHDVHYGKPANDWNGNAVEGPQWGPLFGAQIQSQMTLDGQPIGGCGYCHFIRQEGCGNCHTGNTAGRASQVTYAHANGRVDFESTAGPPAPLGTSEACDGCHSTASVNGTQGNALAKANWTTGALIPCVNCHNAIDPAYSHPRGAGFGIAAPDVLGDDVNYGAEIRGHNRATAAGPYTDAASVQTNVAANKACSDCHDTASRHIDFGTVDAPTSYAGSRLPTSINSVATGSTVTGACNACHTGAGTTPATSLVSTHGNTNATFKATSAHDANAEDFVYNCAACHDVHGMTKNDRTATSANVFMIRKTIGVGTSFTTVPGGAGTTTTSIIFERVSGTDSKDDGLTQADNVCVACHTNANRPGSATAMINTDGNHSENNDYTGNEYGNNCSSCHQHNYDTDAGGTVDGFMPLQCNSCHTYPGLATLGGTHRMGSVHDVHVGRPSNEAAIPNKGFACNTCHYNSNHNTAGITGPAQWTSVSNDTHVQVRFNPNYNPTAAATNPVSTTLDATAFNDTTNTCSQLYCHGSTLGAGGSNTTPSWVINTVVCGSCHDGDGRNGAGVGDGSVASSGNHTDHLTAAYGPNFGATGCNSCHPAYATDALTHVNTTKDFDNVAAAPATSPLGTLPVTTPTATDTDRCTNCHSTYDLGGVGVGATLAKTNWSNGAYQLACFTCHNATDPATRNGDGTGVLAPAKDAYWATRGHGLPNGSTYPWSSARAGADAACADCHNPASAHISGTLGDSDRLTTSGNALCNTCHDGAGAGSAVSQVSTHANTSTTMAGTYTRQRAQFELNCAECHDVHGTTNLFMINTVNTNGPLVATRLYNGVANTTTFLFQGTVAFTDDSVGTSTTSGVGYANPTTGAGSYASWICQACHTATIHFQWNSNDGHVNTDCLLCHKHDFDATFTGSSQDGFMPAGCNGCHGYPPVRAAEVSGQDYVLENYAGGGGQHKVHVEALKAKLSNSTDAREICGPCHGDGAGNTNHAESGLATGVWSTAGRDVVNIRAKAAGQSSWGAAGTYGGAVVDAAGTTPPNAAMDQANSTCANLDCHGNAAAGEGLWWNMSVTDGAGTSDGLLKSQTCKGCHDVTPSQWRVYNAAGSLAYTGNAPNSAANYYATLSGYGRGGHGDANILNEIPAPGTGGRADATGTPPLDCTACHSDAAEHFPENAANLHRLTKTTIENTTGSGLCNDCHARSQYPGEHHPSLQGTLANPTKDIVPAAGQQIFSVPSSWVLVGGEYEQNGYSASAVSGNPDPYVNWWGTTPGNGNQDPPPQPVPFTVLPLLQYVGNQTGVANAVMCVTCHNPHGTDLFVYDPAGTHQSIMDNNMLRAPDSTNVLCNACH